MSSVPGGGQAQCTEGLREGRQPSSAPAAPGRLPEAGFLPIGHGVWPGPVGFEGM